MPLFISAVLSTFCKPLLMIGDPLTAVFTNKSTMTIAGIMVIISGIQTRPAFLKLSVKRAGLLTAVKIAAGLLACMAAMRIFGRDGFLGIPTVAFVTATASFNPALYLALMHDRGDEIDRAGYAWYGIVGMPYLPICILGLSAGYGVDVRAILSTVLLYFLGMILGEADHDLREFSKSGISVLLPFLGISMGSNINLKIAGSALLPGILLFIISSVLNLVPLVLADRLILRQKGYCGTALSAVAGLSITVPFLIAEMDPVWQPYVERASAQLACAVVISAFATPYLFKYVYDTWKMPGTGNRPEKEGNR